MSYSDYALIKKSTLTDIGDTIRAQKGTSELIDPANFSSEIESIEGGSSVENSYTVNFYDYDRVLIEKHTTRVGNRIGSPLSFDAARWETSDGETPIFPLTSSISGEIIDIYSFADTYSDLIYTKFGIDKEEYPYMFIELNDGGGSHNVTLFIAKSVDGIGTNQLTLSEVEIYSGSSIGRYLDSGDIVGAVNAAIEKCNSSYHESSFNYPLQYYARRYVYANFDCENSTPIWYVI